MRLIACVFIVCTACSSCSLYRKQFDYCPRTGVPCTSVSTLEKMMVESPCGEDEFIGYIPKLPEKHYCTADNSISFQRRIWVSPKDSSEPFFLYFEEEYPCD